MPDVFEEQLKAVIEEHADALARSRHSDASDIFNDTGIRDLQTRCLAAIQRVAGKDSVYYQNALKIGESYGSTHDRVAGQIGVAKSLLSDVLNGYLKSLEELVHAELFGDFLEMADHLNSNGYKDAAAVIAGSTLESHLRQLCGKHGVPVTDKGKPRKADTLNADLVKVGSYSKLDQKSVTAWLGLRNDAAHGNYGAYDPKQVTLFISSIRDFITRNPA